MQILVDCSGENEIEKTPETAFLNKKSALLQLVEQSPVSKTIIFCNKVYLSLSLKKRTVAVLIEFETSEQFVAP